LDRLIGEALLLVYDHGEDPDKVFGSSLAARGVSKAAWQSYSVQGKSKTFRQYLLQSAAIGPPMPSSTALRTELRPVVERRILDEVIDRKISSEDPRFKAFLDEMHSSQALHQGGRSFTMNAKHYRYVKAKREEWWKARYSDVDVVVSDKEEGNSCKIGRLGVRLLEQN
jgi:hypothetical protein